MPLETSDNEFDIINEDHVSPEKGFKGELSFLYQRGKPYLSAKIIRFAFISLVIFIYV